MDIATDSFEEQVLQASSAAPVLVDFWAPWCAPCRTLGPILEKLEREYGGRFKLVKVNLDDNPELARAFDVRSIPAVFAFRNGKVAAHFLGAQPESQLRAFIDRLLPSVDEKKIEQAAALIEQGKVDEAARLLGEVRPNIDWDARVEALRAAIGFARSGGNEVELKAKVAANPDDLETRYALAQQLAGARGYPEAMDQLLEIVRRDKQWRDGEARRQLLHLFTLAEADPGLVSQYRRKLATLLY